MAVREDELKNWAPYGLAKPIPANLRNYLGMLDVEAGYGPLYMETDKAIQKIAAQYKDDPKAFKKKMKELESEAWEDFLDMTISQAILWAGAEREAGGEALRDRGLRALLHRLPLRRLRCLGERS